MCANISLSSILHKPISFHKNREVAGVNVQTRRTDRHKHGDLWNYKFSRARTNFKYIMHTSTEWEVLVKRFMASILCKTCHNEEPWTYVVVNSREATLRLWVDICPHIRKTKEVTSICIRIDKRIEVYGLHVDCNAISRWNMCAISKVTAHNSKAGQSNCNYIREGSTF